MAEKTEQNPYKLPRRPKPEASTEVAPASAAPVTARDPQAPPEPWLVRPDSIRLIWIVSGIVLAALVVLDFFIPNDHPYFDIQTLFAFNAWYGFLVCAAFVLVSKLLGILLKVQDDYYDD